MFNDLLKEMFMKYGDEYIDRFKNNIPMAHIKVIQAIQGCGSSSSNTITTRCIECGDYQTHYCSCGNRNCPLCQYHKSQIWLEKRLKEQLPGPYFMLTFTVPKEVLSTRPTDFIMRRIYKKESSLYQENKIQFHLKHSLIPE